MTAIIHLLQRMFFFSIFSMSDHQYSNSSLYPRGTHFELTNRNQSGLDTNSPPYLTSNPYFRRRIPEFGSYYDNESVEGDNDVIYPEEMPYRVYEDFHPDASQENNLEVPFEMLYHPELLPPHSLSPLSIDIHDPNLREYHYQLQRQQQRQRQLQWQRQQRQQQQPMFTYPKYPITRDEYSPINPINPINSMPENTGREQSLFAVPDPYYPSHPYYVRYPLTTPHLPQSPYSSLSPRSMSNTPFSSYPPYAPMSDPLQNNLLSSYTSPISARPSDHFNRIPEEVDRSPPSAPVLSRRVSTTGILTTPTDNVNSMQSNSQPENKIAINPGKSDNSGKLANTKGGVLSSNNWRKADEAYSPLTKEEVRRNLQQVLNWPYYKELWDQIERTVDGRSVFLVQQLKQYPKDNVASPISELIRKCISLKKACRLLSARKLFLSLLDAFDGDAAIWIDFSRMEMESGEYQNALVLLQAARTQFPYHQALITKLVKVEEKLQMGDELIQLTQELINYEDPKIMRLLCEILLSLTRIGYIQYAQTVIGQLAESFATSPGWLCYEILSLMYYLEPLPVVYQAITQILELCPKHGPMWIFAMRWTENMYIELWSRQSVYDLIHNQEYLNIVERAKRTLTADILWKVLLEIMQQNARTMFILRFYFYYKVR